jgi:DNA-binding transcriptional LysR family regulator
MQLQHLKVFYEVARSGSISEASRKLRITQPSISRTVKSLEDSLGKKLFLRKSRGVTLTEDGGAIYQRCHIIFKECDAISSEKEMVVSRMRIAASENICLHILPKVFENSEMKKRFSKIQIEITSGTAVEVAKAVINGIADFGYCYHASRVPGIFSEPLIAVPFVLVVARHLFKSRPTVKQLDGLAQIGSLGRDYDAGAYAAKSLLTQIGLQSTEIVHQSNSQETQINLAVAGLGYTLVPWFLAKPRIDSKELFEVSTPRSTSTMLYRMSRQGVLAPPFQEVFEALLLQELKRT